MFEIDGAGLRFCDRIAKSKNSDTYGGGPNLLYCIGTLAAMPNYLLIQKMVKECSKYSTMLLSYTLLEI